MANKKQQIEQHYVYRVPINHRTLSLSLSLSELFSVSAPAHHDPDYLAFTVTSNEPS